MIIAWILLLLAFTQLSTSQEVRKASQCFKSRGIPRVEFACAAEEMIQIERAFHGIALAERSDPNCGSNCSYCTGDCIDASMNLVYDWSTCMGNTSCVRTVMQSYMPSCPGRDKFSDYLQVEYHCVPRSSVMDICQKVSRWVDEGFLMSPNYPAHYPISMDCLCRLSTDSHALLVLSFYDLLLETRNGRCRADWLMLRQGGQKHRHCGAIMTGTKNLTSTSNEVRLQFHSDTNNNRTQAFQYFSRSLKGFWLHFRAEPRSSVQVQCRPLTPNDREVKEISVDDQDYDEVVQTKEEEDDAENEVDTGEDKVKVPTGKPKNQMKPSPNEVDYQGGQERSSAGHHWTLPLALRLLPLLLLML